MARTHFGSTPRLGIDVRATQQSDAARRVRPPNVVTGNYTTFRLFNHKAVANNDVRVLQDRVFLPMGFRVSAIATDTLAATATVTVFVDNSATTSTLITGGQVVSDNTQHQVLPAGLNPVARSIAQNGSLDLTISANGTGAAAVGTIMVWVTGYFTTWITPNGSPTEPDLAGIGLEPVRVTHFSGPVAGCYDIIAFRNLRANANQATRQECSVTLPYNCRLMALNTHIKAPGDATFTTGTTQATFDNSALGQIISIDLDVVQLFQADVDGFTPLDSAKIDFLQGQKINMKLATGVADTVPIGALSAHALVWVRGHVAGADHKELD